MAIKAELLSVATKMILLNIEFEAITFATSAKGNVSLPDFALGHQISRLHTPLWNNAVKGNHPKVLSIQHIVLQTLLCSSAFFVLLLKVSTQGWIHWWHNNMSASLPSLFCFLHSDETWRKSQETTGRWISGKGFTHPNTINLSLLDRTPYFYFNLY